MDIVAFPVNGRTAAENLLQSAYRDGRPLDLTRTRIRHDTRVLSGDPDRVIRAEVIRNLVLSDAPGSPGRIRQIDITGALVLGPLDLRFADINCPIRFRRCVFDSVVDLTEARMRSVSLRGCMLPGIRAGHVSVAGDLDLSGVHLTGPLRLAGAHLEDDLHLRGARIEPPDSRVDGIAHARSGEPALDLANIGIKGSLDADHLFVYGKVSMPNARVGGSLKMTSVVVTAEKGTDAWDGDGMEVVADLDATGLRASGGVRLVDARVLALVLKGIRIENSGTALVLDRLASQGSVYLDDGSRLTGGVQAIGIQVNATVYLDGMHTSGPPERVEPCAVNLSRAKVTGDVWFKDRFRAVGRVALTGAQVGGQVLMPDASLRAGENDQRRLAFVADRAEIGGDLRAGGEFTCVGTMSLVNARIGGEFSVEHSRQARQERSMLAAAGLRVARSVTLRTVGAVDLDSAEVAGGIDLDLGRLIADGERAAADLSRVRAAALSLRGTQLAGPVDLTRASVRRLIDDPTQPIVPGSLVLEGFEYAEVGEGDIRSRLRWLKCGTQRVRKPGGGYRTVLFTPQPYTQLAATYRRAGRDRDARSILCHMHREQNRSVTSWRQWYSKLWNYAQDCFLGYGYVPSRALIWLLGMAMLSSVWFTSQHQKPIGVLGSALLSVGLVLPGAGYEKIEHWEEGLSDWSHVIAAFLVLAGLLLGATVIAALARVIKR